MSTAAPLKPQQHRVHGADGLEDTAATFQPLPPLRQSQHPKHAKKRQPKSQFDPDVLDIVRVDFVVRV